MASNREVLIHKMRSGEPLSSMEKAAAKVLVERGLISPSDMDPETRMGAEEAAEQRSLADLLKMEGGGLQESLPPMSPAESLVGDFTGDLRKRFGQPPTAPTGMQAAAQGGLGMAGGVAGQMVGGRLGSMAGSAGGVLIGGLLTGRGADALWDSLYQLGAEGAMNVPGAAAKRSLAPKVSARSKAALEQSGASDLIEAGIPAGQSQQYKYGSETVENIKAGYQSAYSKASARYNKLRESIGDIDLSDIEAIAKERGIDFQGAKAVSGGDPLLINALLGKEARGLRARGDAIKASNVEHLAELLDSKIEQAAQATGQGGAAYAQAKRQFMKEVAEPYINGKLSDIVEHSGRQVVSQLSGEKVSGLALRSTVDEARQIVKGIEGTGVDGALETFRAGIISQLLESSTDAKGVIRPEGLARVFQRTPPETLDAYLGKELHGAMRDLVENYSAGKVRIATSVEAGGMAATATGIAGAGGGMASIGGLEAANELSYLGRRIASSPKVANALKMAVLGRDERKLMGLFPKLTSMRLVGGQLAGAGLRQVFQRQPDEDY
jgi:hypothetical protein